MTAKQQLRDARPGVDRRTFMRVGGAAAGAALLWPWRTAGASAAARGDSTVQARAVQRVVEAQAAVEGAGVRLRRAFGFHERPDFDPFLLLDDFRNDNPKDYIAGFPWHPHRGIETVTYVLTGSVDHEDSLGNVGTLGAGDVQWMTAGSGILHQEMPRGDPEGRMHGFQLWANLPAALKMSQPRYQDVPSAEIPVVTDDDGTTVRVVCGGFWGKRGPVDGIAAQPRYLDVSIPPGICKSLPIETTRRAFAYVFSGSGDFEGGSAGDGEVGSRSLVQFDQGNHIVVLAGQRGVRFLFVSGQAIEEPIAWRGPIVMNTQDELVQAYRELRDGDFIKPR